MMMFGKAFASMYQGSMVGAGLHVFAVWNYAIALADRGFVELNPKYLGPVLGGSEKQIKDALEYLTAKDPASRSTDEEGRRLLQKGRYLYQLVNWETYQLLRTKAQLREYNRIKQQEYREKKKHGTSIPVPAGSNSRRRAGGIPTYAERLQTECVHDGEWVAGTLAGMERCVACGLEREKVDPEQTEVEPV